MRVITFPAQFIPGYIQTADTVSCSTGNNQATLTGSLDVPNPAACPCLGTGKRSNAGGEIMCLCSQQRIIANRCWAKRRANSRPLRHNRFYIITGNYTGVILKGNNRSLGICVKSVCHQIKKGALLHNAIYYLPAFEKSVPGMF